MRMRSRVGSAARQDITRGDLAYDVRRLAWPSLLNQFLFLAPPLYDALWLGRLGAKAQAAGLATSVRITMASVLMALGSASGAVVARYVGARDREKADLAALQAVLLMVLASGVLGAAGFVWAGPLMRLAGADAAGAPQIGLGMRLWSMGTLLLAEPLLVSRLGVRGAALALVLSGAAGALWGLGALVAGRAPVRVDLRRLGVRRSRRDVRRRDVRRLRPDAPLLARILRVALPAVLQHGAPNLAMSLLTRLVSSYGAPTLAAWVIARRVLSFAHIPSAGLARVVPAMVGQNLGARKPERAARAVGLVARAVAATMVVVLGGLALLAPQVMALFGRDAERVWAGARILRALSLGYLAFALNTVFDAALAGAGDTVSPMAINGVALWLIQVPLAWLLSRALALGATGVWIALVVGWLAQAVLKGWRYRQGSWKTRQI